jgi:hypothetical protein
MAAKRTRLTHKIAIQLHVVAEICTICSSRFRRPVRKLLDTPSYFCLCEAVTSAVYLGSRLAPSSWSFHCVFVPLSIIRNTDSYTAFCYLVATNIKTSVGYVCLPAVLPYRLRWVNRSPSSSLYRYARVSPRPEED